MIDPKLDLKLGDRWMIVEVAGRPFPAAGLTTAEKLFGVECLRVEQPCGDLECGCLTPAYLPMHRALAMHEVGEAAARAAVSEIAEAARERARSPRPHRKGY